MASHASTASTVSVRSTSDPSSSITGAPRSPSRPDCHAVPGCARSPPSILTLGLPIVAVGVAIVKIEDDRQPDAMDTQAEAAVASPYATMTGVLKMTPCFRSGKTELVPAIRPYPPTKETTMHLPAAAKQLMGGEVKRPIDYIPPGQQLPFIPVVHGALAVPLTEEEQEKLAEENRVGAAGSMFCKQVELEPEFIELTIDMELNQLSVCTKFTNPTDACGEACVTMAPLDGWTCVTIQEKVAEYPFESWVRTNDEALRHYKETNRSETKGSAVTASTRKALARKCKVPGKDSFTVTFTFQVSDPEALWREMPFSPAPEGQPPTFPTRAWELAVFTPPGNGKTTTPVRIKVCRPGDEGLSFALPTSQAVEEEVAERQAALGYGTAVYYMHTEGQKADEDGWEVVPAKCAPSERGELQLAADFSFSAPFEPICLKLRLEDERPRHDDLSVAQLAAQMGSLQVAKGQGCVRVLSHARLKTVICDKAGKPLGNAVAACEVILPDAMPDGVEALRDPKDVHLLLIIDASGSMYAYCPHTAKLSNLGKVELEVEGVCFKLLRLPAFLKEHGLAIEGDRILLNIARFHSRCTMIASDIDLTSAGAEAEVRRAVADFKACTDSGGTTYCSWLSPLEAMLKKPGEHIVFLGTDGGAYDKREFLGQLDGLKAVHPKMQVMVVAMGAYLDEDCARKTQNAGHRLMKDVGPGFTDLAYQMLFKALVRRLQGMTLEASGRFLTVADYSGEMPATTHNPLAVDGVGSSLPVDLGTRFVVTVLATYSESGGAQLQLPKFTLGKGGAPFAAPSATHLSANPIAVLKYLDPFYCSPSLRFVGDAQAMLHQAVEGVGLLYSRDTSRTKTGADFHYPDAKGKLSPMVKAAMIADPLREGLLQQHQNTTMAWMNNAGVSRPYAMHENNHCGYDPLDTSWGSGLSGGVVYRSCGADDDSAPAFRSLSAGDDDAPVTRSAAPPPPAPKPSAETKHHLEGIPSAEVYVKQYCGAYYAALPHCVLLKVVQQLDTHEKGLVSKCAAAQASPRYGLRSKKLLDDEDMLDAMADAQGDGEAGAAAYLDGVAAELRAMVGVLAHMAFLRREATGVDIFNQPFGPGPLTADMLLLRVRYLRELAQRILGMGGADDPKFYRPIITFDDFVENASPAYSSFKASLKWVEAPQLLDIKGKQYVLGDRRVDGCLDAIKDACAYLTKAWAEHVGMANGAVFPGDGVVRLISEPKGFDAKEIVIPHYCNKPGLEEATSIYRPYHGPFDQDAKYFADLPDTISKEIFRYHRVASA